MVLERSCSAIDTQLRFLLGQKRCVTESLIKTIPNNYEISCKVKTRSHLTPTL